MLPRVFGRAVASARPVPCGQVRTVIRRAEPPGVMLAHSYKNQDVSGWYSSEKLDGIRAFWTGTKLQTRNGVVLYTPKDFVAGMKKYFPKQRVDGELFLGKDMFQQTMGAVMKHTDIDANTQWRVGGKTVEYVVFDIAPGKKSEEAMPFTQRLKRMKEVDVALRKDRKAKTRLSEFIKVIKYKRLSQDRAVADATVQADLKTIIAAKGEGLMLRAPESMYVNGRSAALLKVKEVEDSEALVVDWQEGEGKHKGFVGSLRCRLHNGIYFEVGTGLTDSFRLDPKEFLDKVITVRHQGVTDFGVPRFPVFVGVRLDRSPSEFDLLSSSIEKLAAEFAASAQLDKKETTATAKGEAKGNAKRAAPKKRTRKQ